MAAPCSIEIMGDFAKLGDVDAEDLEFGHLGDDFAQHAVQIIDSGPGVGIKECDERGFNIGDRLSAAARKKTAAAHIHDNANEPPPEACTVVFPRELVQQRADIVGGIQQIVTIHIVSDSAAVSLYV